MAKPASRRSTTRKAASSAPRVSAAERNAAERAERERREELRHAPVSLPSGGSFEQTALAKALDGATDTATGNRDAEVSQALEENNRSASTATTAPNTLPDHSLARADVQLVKADENGDGGVVVSELRQVYDPSKVPAPVSADRNAPVADAGDNDGRSQVLSLETVSAAPLSAPVDSSVPATTGATGEPGTTSNIDATTAAVAGALHDTQTSSADDAA